MILKERFANPKSVDDFAEGIRQNAYSATIYGALRACGVKPEERWDLMQDTYLKAFKYFDKYDGTEEGKGTNFKGWLARIARNTAINKHRQWQGRGSPRYESLDDLKQEQREKVCGITVQSEDTEELSPDLRDALNSLPWKFKCIIGAVDIEELSYDETARILRIPIGTVMSGLSRARKAVAEQMIQYHVPQNMNKRDAASIRNAVAQQYGIRKKDVGCIETRVLNAIIDYTGGEHLSKQYRQRLKIKLRSEEEVMQEFKGYPAAVQKAYAQLSENKIYSLFAYTQGYTFEQIAAQLGTSDRVIRSYVDKGMIMIAEHIANQYACDKPGENVEKYYEFSNTIFEQRLLDLIQRRLRKDPLQRLAA